MVKTHLTTGLKYLCKRSKGDWATYPGSGKYWTNHLKKHGYDFKTDLLFSSDDPEEFQRKSIEISKQFDVVQSHEWANLIHETGLDGGPIFDQLPTNQQNEIRSKISRLHKSRIFTPEHRQRISIGRKNMSSDARESRKKKCQEAMRSPKNLQRLSKQSETRIGNRNPNSKSITFGNLIFGSISEAMSHFGQPRHIVTSKKFKEKHQRENQINHTCREKGSL